MTRKEALAFIKEHPQRMQQSWFPDFWRHPERFHIEKDDAPREWITDNFYQAYVSIEVPNVSEVVVRCAICEADFPALVSREHLAEHSSIHDSEATELENLLTR